MEEKRNMMGARSVRTNSPFALLNLCSRSFFMSVCIVCGIEKVEESLCACV